MVCSKEIGPVSREKVDPKLRVIIFLRKTENRKSYVISAYEEWAGLVDSKSVQIAYAQCCDAAQALRAWIGSENHYN